MFRPMLGVAVEDVTQLQYPLMASPKLDGVRALWIDGNLHSRTMKLIPNMRLRQAIRDLNPPPGLDGELIFGSPTARDVYRQTVSAVMTEAASAEGIHWYVFDLCLEPQAFLQRQAWLPSMGLIEKLSHAIVSSPEELLELELATLDAGYEGLILRAMHGKYKQGRSTLREQGMLKLKRFQDAEAQVIGFEELQHNANVATLDERGYTKRSSHQENKVGMNTLGALVLDWHKQELRVGTGFTEAERQQIWDHQERYLGWWAKFKYLPVGVKDLPRHPVWLGWRSPIDM